MASPQEPSPATSAGAANQLAAKRSAAVRDLNDAFRRTLSGGRVMMTASVAALPERELAAVCEAVRGHSNFTPGNDPFGEHDFGAFGVGGVRYLWRIDAYDKDLSFGSPDASDHRHDKP